MKIKKIIMSIMDRLFMNCKEATYYSSIEVDKGKIPVFPKIKYKTHLKYCKDCNNFSKQTRQINKILLMTPEEIKKTSGKTKKMNNKKKEIIVNKLKKQKHHNNL